MIRECFSIYDNIPPTTNDETDEDENDIALEDDDVHDVDLTKVIEGQIFHYMKVLQQSFWLQCFSYSIASRYLEFQTLVQMKY